MTATESDGIRCERPDARVARIVLARPDVRNAQDRALLYALDRAFVAAMSDDQVRVVILAADGPHFSSGHDLRDTSSPAAHGPVGAWGGFALPGAEGLHATEQELFLGLAWRWRNLPKPTIAQVQGKAIAGGLLLAWVCDLIVAADDAAFSDPTVALGSTGHELFVHPWELGARKAKELLFTAGELGAREALALGMVNAVVPGERLEDETLALARRIARHPTVGLKLAKQAVNQALDAQGQWTAVQSAFGLHQLAHAHNMQVHGALVDPDGVAAVRAALRTTPEEGT